MIKVHTKIHTARCEVSLLKFLSLHFQTLQKGFFFFFLNYFFFFFFIFYLFFIPSHISLFLTSPFFSHLPFSHISLFLTSPFFSLCSPHNFLLQLTITQQHPSKYEYRSHKYGKRDEQSPQVREDFLVYSLFASLIIYT
jgi:polyferredoxin